MKSPQVLGFVCVLEATEEVGIGASFGVHPLAIVFEDCVDFALDRRDVPGGAAGGERSAQQQHHNHRSQTEPNPESRTGHRTLFF